MGNFDRKAWHKALYESRKAAGRCTKCGDYAVNTYCFTCSERRRLRSAGYVKSRRASGKCIGCGREIDVAGKKTCSYCRSSYKRRRHLDKLAAYEAYGGPFCACCGESDLSFLVIDHIEGGGGRHRIGIGGSDKLYAWLKNKGYPAGFRVLCHNCNMGSYLNGGICPHQQQLIELLKRS